MLNKWFIKKQIGKMDLNLSTFCEKHGWDYNNFSSLINGKVDCRLSTLIKLAGQLSCGLDDLVESKEDK